MNFLKKITQFIILSLGIFTGASETLAGDIYALSVGINDYQNITRLHGAVNDSDDLISVLKKMGANTVIQLTNEDATRENIKRSWKQLTDMAGADDLVFFHYAGHGARQSAIIPGHEQYDNMFLLYGFKDAGEGTRERLVDNEIGHLLAQEKEATVIFVADSCFAGGMTRGLDFRTGLKSRFTKASISPQSDGLRNYLTQLGEVDSSDLNHVLWVYAQDEKREIPEIAINGKPRGVLSFALARALEGKADRDGCRW